MVSSGHIHLEEPLRVAVHVSPNVVPGREGLCREFDSRVQLSEVEDQPHPYDVPTSVRSVRLLHKVCRCTCFTLTASLDDLAHVWRPLQLPDGGRRMRTRPMTKNISWTALHKERMVVSLDYDEDTKMQRCEDAKMRRCKDAKMQRCKGHT